MTTNPGEVDRRLTASGSISDVEAIIARVLPPDVSVVVATEAMYSADLLPGEKAGTERMVEKRLREFTAGRTAARAALRTLGFPATPLPIGVSRYPVWPKGSVGTISHCKGVCVAAVARTSTTRALGLDVELDVPLEPDLEAMVLTPEERQRLSGVNGEDRGRLGKLAFSAKESVFKCWHPIEHRWLDFLDATVAFNDEWSRWTATILRKPERNFPSELSGLAARGAGIIITGAHLKP